MRLEIELKSNDNCWLIGKVTHDEDYICDSLAMGDYRAIPAGLYNLSIVRDTVNNTDEIVISKQRGSELGRFVTKPTYQYKIWQIRYDTTNIVLGTIMKDFSMTMCEYAAKRILLLVHAALWARKPCELLIIDAHNVLKSNDVVE